MLSKVNEWTTIEKKPKRQQMKTKRRRRKTRFQVFLFLFELISIIKSFSFSLISICITLLHSTKLIIHTLLNIYFILSSQFSTKNKPYLKKKIIWEFLVNGEKFQAQIQITNRISAAVSQSVTLIPSVLRPNITDLHLDNL